MGRHRRVYISMKRLTDTQRKDLCRSIDSIRYKLPHLVSNPWDVKWYWHPLRAGVLGKFSVLHPNRIVLSSSFIRSGPEWGASTAIHELRHRYQFIINPAIYLVACPFRKWTIEPSAQECERAADQLLGFGGLRNAD